MASQPSQANQAEAKSPVDQYPAQTHCHLFNEIFFGTDRQEFHVRFVSLIISRTTALRPGSKWEKGWLCGCVPRQILSLRNQKFCSRRLDVLDSVGTALQVWGRNHKHN
jgi:hypothetical protein